MLCGRTRETQHEYFNIDAEPVARADSRRQFAARGSAHTFEIKMAAHRPKEDILVHYDEEAGELIFIRFQPPLQVACGPTHSVVFARQ